MVEQRTENPRVAGSIPARGTIFLSNPVNPVLLIKKMRIRVISLTLFIPGALTLKDKRQVIQSITARVRKLNVSVAEVDFLEQWQLSKLAMAMVSKDQAYLESLQQEIVKLIEEQYQVEITDTIIEDY